MLEQANTIEQFIVYVHRNEAHITYIVFQADNIYKNPPQNVISPIFFYFFLFVFRSGAPPKTLLTAGGASINHGRNMDETWTIHGQLASSIAAQRLRHALSRKRCAARSIGVHGTLMYLNLIFMNCYYRTRILIQ